MPGTLSGRDWASAIDATCSTDALDRDHPLSSLRFVGTKQPNGPAAHVVARPELKLGVDEVRMNTFDAEGRRRDGRRNRRDVRRRRLIGHSDKDRAHAPSRFWRCSIAWWRGWSKKADSTLVAALPPSSPFPSISAALSPFYCRPSKIASTMSGARLGHATTSVRACRPLPNARQTRHRRFRCRCRNGLARGSRVLAKREGMVILFQVQARRAIECGRPGWDDPRKDRLRAIGSRRGRRNRPVERGERPRRSRAMTRWWTRA